MSRTAGWPRIVAVLLILSLSSCGAREGQEQLLTNGPKPTATLSPQLVLFREAGLDLADDAEIAEVFAFTLDGERCEVLEYESSTGSGLQIKVGNQLLTDADVAFQVLLSYAWAPEHHGLIGDDLSSLRELQGNIHNAQQEYGAFFRFAEALTPAMQRVDELKDKQITGIPVLPSPSLPLIDIANWWDLICTIPLNVFDLCLLEPLLREINEQGVEIEKLLVVADTDLAKVISQLEGQVQHGLTLKVSVQEAISSLDNLLWKLDEFKANALRLQAITQEGIRVLETQQWGSKVDKVISLLKAASPGFDPSDMTGGLLSALQNLDQRLTAFLDKADNMTADIETRLALLTAARVRTEQTLDSLGKEWRARPISP